ncbi:MAG: methyltransferase domain-containing protein [Chloroflexi bacterium]|nr:methyltransferase domain-containing protein [Chloroflexota bacterium]
MKTITNTGRTCPPPYIPSSEKMTMERLQGAYNEIADGYEKMLWFDQHILGVARHRRQLISRASGRILDLACGTGLNFPFFPPTSEIIAVDLSPRMLDVARQKAKYLNLNVQAQIMDAGKLEFGDAGFDTVTSTLSTCTFPDPIQALREMQRVCRPDGLILLLEHGHSSMPWLAQYQDRHVFQHYQQNAGCRWNQDPVDLVKTAGLKILNSQRFGLGMFYAIVAAP